MAKMIMTNFYCLDCGAVNSILISEIDQFSSEHNIINTKAIKHENYEPNTISDLRDYYFRLLMNYYDFNFYRRVTIIRTMFFCEMEYNEIREEYFEMLKSMDRNAAICFLKNKYVF